MSLPSNLGLPLSSALQHSEPLVGLLQRVRESQARLALITPLLPPGLVDGTRAGPLDDSAWVLLVDNAAAAAKLKQLLPTLQDALAQQGLAHPPAKVRVRARTLPAER